MNTVILVLAVILFTIAAAAFVISIFQFAGKGFLLNNAYIYATKSEREQMNKRPYYVQSGVIIALVGIVFVLLGIEVVLQISWMSYLVVIAVALLAVFTLVSSIVINNRKK